MRKIAAQVAIDPGSAAGQAHHPEIPGHLRLEHSGGLKPVTGAGGIPDQVHQRLELGRQVRQQLFQRLCRRSPAEGLSRPGVESEGHGRQLSGAVHAQVCTLWKVLSEQAVRVLVGAALPRTARIAEVDA